MNEASYSFALENFPSLKSDCPSGNFPFFLIVFIFLILIYSEIKECFTIDYSIETSQSSLYTNWYFDQIKIRRPRNFDIIRSVRNLDEAKRDIAYIYIYYKDLINFNK